MMTDNLYANLPPPGTPDELFSTLLDEPGLIVRRIVSTGQCSPPGFWYDQPEAEWVLLLSGAARLRFEDEDVDRPLKPGDYLEITAGRRHRVEWTSPEQPTIWLAIHRPAVTPA